MHWSRLLLSAVFGKAPVSIASLQNTCSWNIVPAIRANVIPKIEGTDEFPSNATATPITEKPHQTTATNESNTPVGTLITTSTVYPEATEVQDDTPAVSQPSGPPTSTALSPLRSQYTPGYAIRQYGPQPTIYLPSFRRSVQSKCQFFKEAIANAPPAAATGLCGDTIIGATLGFIFPRIVVKYVPEKRNSSRIISRGPFRGKFYSDGDMYISYWTEFSEPQKS